MIGVTVWVAAFFRDPVRTTPTDPKLIVSPADGLVTMITRVPAPPELRTEMGEGEFTRVSIFMSVFDVHINRTPIAGTIRRIAYIPGKFLNADLDKASEDNERQHFVVENDLPSRRHRLAPAARPACHRGRDGDCRVGS
jgi:phosphatidylserine decarboxylase